MNGIILINKEKGCTSHDVVYKVKKLTNSKVGHTGTLDPNATGVLPLLIGEATKISKYLINHDKEYEVVLELGKKTSTADVEGEVIEEKEVSAKSIEEQYVKEILKTFIGKQEQTPPIYSAIKVNGKKLYEYARKGQEVKLEPRQIEIYDIELLNINKTEKQIYRFLKGDTDLSLRFDLTVPLAKYVAQNYNNLSFPFRRYQIGKVYRGERQQKGRFREFYQCDIDIIGDEKLSIINDAELPSVIYSIFNDLGFGDFTICINNRKILNGLFSSLKLEEISADILRIIDKIEKIGKEEVKNELEKLNIEAEKIDSILGFITMDGNTDDKLEKLKKLNLTITAHGKTAGEVLAIIEYAKDQMSTFETKKCDYLITILNDDTVYALIERKSGSSECNVISKI